MGMSLHLRGLPPQNALSHSNHEKKKASEKKIPIWEHSTKYLATALEFKGHQKINEHKIQGEREKLSQLRGA